MNLHELVRMVQDQERRIAELEAGLKTLEARLRPAMPTQPRPQGSGSASAPSGSTLTLPGKKASDGV